MQTLHNRWRQGVQHFVYSTPPAWATSTGGVRFDYAVIDPDIGEEVIGTLIDPTPFAHQLVARKPFQLRLNSGAAQTSFGPILFLLWWVPPVTAGKPFALYEHTLNATNPTTLKLLTALASQTHLHLGLVGPGQKLLDFLEFENNFEFEKLVSLVEAGCRNYPRRGGQRIAPASGIFSTPSPGRFERMPLRIWSFC